MSKKIGVLQIELKSDFCPGSGYSFAGVVDSDVSYNRNGIPCILGRRLKGCLKEAAELIGTENIEEIFGSSANNRTRGILVGNAFPAGYEELDEELTALKECGSPYKQDLETQKVLEQYTRLKAQTSIDAETGTARNNTLRFTRVISRYFKGSGEPLRFLAKIEYDDEEVSEQQLEGIAKALRHIGMNRSRGLGNVECRFLPGSTAGPDGKPASDGPKAQRPAEEAAAEGPKAQRPAEETAAEGPKTQCPAEEAAANGPREQRAADSRGKETPARLDYIIQNVQPLVITGTDSSQTNTRIRGQIVLGALADAWRKHYGGDGEDPVFQDIFLKGTVLFSDLLPALPEEKLLDDGLSFQRSFSRYEPVPRFICRLKKTKKLVNLSGDMTGTEGTEYDPENGNQPKKLGGHYLHINSEGQASLMEPERDIVYHHSKKQKSPNGEEGILYTLEVLQEGQYFSGSFYGPEKYLTLLKELLPEYPLRLGKSRSAQYGGCRVVSCEFHDAPETVRVKAGERILAAFVSDALFIGENGYTVNYEEVKARTAADLGFSYKTDVRGEHEFLQTCVINGYHSMWNLKKPSFPALAAGSVLEYTAAEDCEISRRFCGEKNLEGFGEIRIYKLADMEYRMQEYTPCPVMKKPEKTLPMLLNILTDTLLEAMNENAFSLPKMGLTASTLGRVTMMLSESLDENRGEWEAAFREFVRRVESIKRTTEKEKVQSFLAGCICTDKTLAQLDVRKMVQKDKTEFVEYQKLKTLNQEEAEKRVRAHWGDYLMHILVHQKYLLKA